FGTSYNAVSQTVSVTVLAVSALVVTPDEAEPSATIAPHERITRLFSICNAGNTPDTHTITRAEVSAPAQIVGLYFDADKSGTVSDGDVPIRAGEGATPQLARSACLGLLAVVDTGASEPGSRLSIGITARSNIIGAANGAAEDVGTVINTVGNGVRFSAPDDARLQPVKFVNDRDRVTTAHGQTLVYKIAFRNSGDTVARRALVADELPEGLEYVAGSLRLDTRALTDADDADEGHVVNRRIEVRLAEVAVGALVEIAFQARTTSGVAPGRGIINTATISADNSTSVETSEAIVIVNPFGLVYEGRSGSTISGARIQLLADAGSGTILPLAPASGSMPNEANDNPFTTDAGGRWSFALAPAQFGTAISPARYYLNVTAPGFRARMIEVTLTPLPSGSGSLFALTVRALDGQPIASGGSSFELTSNSVLIDSLAALALNVPLFETSTLEIVKGVDRASVEIGDVISYRVEVRNATSVPVDNVTVSDALPTSFHYAPGSARVENPPDPTRAVEPEISGGAMLFRLGQLRAGGRATITYRVRIGVNAGEGEQVNTAVASGTFASGETVATVPGRASVRVRRGVFSTQQIIVGRVFEDANANGLFDRGERPVAGVRLYLANGHLVVTDSAGLYNFPSVGDGAQVISLDPVTLPPGYALAEAQTRDAKSWTRLLRTPLGGGALLRQNFALKSAKKQNEREAPKSKLTTLGHYAAFSFSTLSSSAMAASTSGA
ncbi:MAG: DUF11 domain-containing protein, partial [Pyrinomonadaceae bacterium]|nr:DUF11 domain-containing protein [Pyrinomonadaceae bacterium]